MAPKKRVERVKVHCRVRPFLNSEQNEGQFVTGDVGGEKNNDLVTLKGEESFQFDSYLDDKSTQESVYDKVAAPIVSSVLEGYNGTVFAYGQTGSGKTFSMFGGKTTAEAGIVPRSLAHIFQVVNSDEEYEYTISLSYVQLYCELLTDLLSPAEDAGLVTQQSTIGRPVMSSSLSIRECSRRGVFIEGVKSQQVTSAEEAMSFIQEGDEHRVRASTNMNETSSRSHACIIVNITKRKADDVNTDEKKQTFVKYGKLILVDLAGSERVKKALGANHQVHGTRFMESKAINLSLSALGNCISALAKKNNHVPYRDAKLTRLLKDSLGGNSMTALVLNIAPHGSHYSETKSTLTFGQRAMNVQTRVSINQEIDFKALYSGVQVTLDQKDDRITELEIALRKMQIELDESKKHAETANEDKEIVQMQLKTVSISSDAAEQIEALQKEHASSLRKVREEYDAKLSKEKLAASTHQEDWHRIEYELKDEREEHLRTCALLREKQQQLAELEKNKSDRIAELFEELKSSQEKIETLTQNLEVAFQQRNEMTQKVKELQGELEKSKEFQERGLKLMQKLTNRVEQLEKRTSDSRGSSGVFPRQEDDDGSERRRSSRFNDLSKPKRTSLVARQSHQQRSRTNNNQPTNQHHQMSGGQRHSAFAQHMAQKKNGNSILRSSATASILRF